MKIYIITCFAFVLAWANAHAQGFVKVTDPNNPLTKFNVLPNHLYVGAAWVDVDNDGDVDLFAAPNQLFENIGNGAFQPKSTAIGDGLMLAAYPFAGISWADVDNDGDLDCYYVGNLSVLYFNDGKGVFTAQAAAPPNATVQGWGAAWGDYNNDGFVDLAVAQPATGAQGAVFANLATINWETISVPPFTSSEGPYTVPTWADYDDDGDSDLFVAAGPAVQPPAAPDFIYKNMLKETGSPALKPLTGFPFDLAQDGQSYNFVDYDNDGDLDICLTNYAFAPNRLYRNDGNQTYFSISTPFTDAALTNCLSNAWGDFDLDGDLDVVFTRDNGLTARLYTNNGAGNFSLDATSPVSQHITSTGCSIGDYDNDGDLDLFLNGRSNNTTAGRALYRNTLAKGRHWVSFALTGVTSNRAAIGAKVRISAKIGGTVTKMRRDVSAQNTFQGQNDLRVHFGLGDAAVIDALEIVWPSGAVTTCSGLASDQFYEIREQNGVWDKCLPNYTQEASLMPIQVWPVPANDYLSLSLPPDYPCTSCKVNIFDPLGNTIQTVPFSDHISISTLPVGFYWLSITAEGKTLGKHKFIRHE